MCLSKVLNLRIEFERAYLKPILINSFNYLKPFAFQIHGSTDFKRIEFERACLKGVLKFETVLNSIL